MKRVSKILSRHIKAYPQQWCNYVAKNDLIILHVTQTLHSCPNKKTPPPTPAWVAAVKRASTFHKQASPCSKTTWVINKSLRCTKSQQPKGHAQHNKTYGWELMLHKENQTNGTKTQKRQKPDEKTAGTPTSSALIKARSASTQDHTATCLYKLLTQRESVEQYPCLCVCACVCVRVDVFVCSWVWARLQLRREAIAIPSDLKTRLPATSKYTEGGGRQRAHRRLKYRSVLDKKRGKTHTHTHTGNQVQPGITGRNRLRHLFVLEWKEWWEDEMEGRWIDGRRGTGGWGSCVLHLNTPNGGTNKQNKKKKGECVFVLRATV